MKRVGISEIRAILSHVADLMSEKKDELTRLDSAVGDGDLGLTMERAFVAARNDVLAAAEKDVGQLLTNRHR